MTLKNLALYYNVKVYVNSFFKKMSFSNHLVFFQTSFKEQKHWSHCFKNVFGYFLFINSFQVLPHVHIIDYFINPYFLNIV
jgi:hypothetical protein